MRSKGQASRSFRSVVAKKNLAALGHAGWLALGFSPPFAALYGFTLGGHSRLMVLLTLLCGLTGAAMVAVSRRGKDRAARLSGPLTVAFFLLVGGTLALGGLLHGGYESSQYLGVLLAIVVASQLFLWSGLETLCAFGLLYTFWTLPLVAGWIEVGNLKLAFEQQFFVLSLLALGSYFGQRRLLVERRRFRLQLRCRRLGKRVRRQAATDSLTGLANRRSFAEISRREHAHMLREGGKATVAIVDIDEFKRINDELGHAAGDGVLRGLASVLVQRLRRTDVAARLGGDEFAVLLSSTDSDGARSAMERIRRVIADSPVVFDGQSIGFTLSVGVAELDRLDTGVEGVLARADHALYRAKRDGRDRIACWNAREEQNSSRQGLASGPGDIAHGLARVAALV